MPSSGTCTPPPSSVWTGRSTGCACRTSTHPHASPGSSATNPTASGRSHRLVPPSRCWRRGGGTERTRSCSRPSSTPPPARCASPIACRSVTTIRIWCAPSRASPAPSTCAWISQSASTTARWSLGSPRGRAWCASPPVPTPWRCGIASSRSARTCTRSRISPSARTSGSPSRWCGTPRPRNRRRPSTATTRCT